MTSKWRLYCVDENGWQYTYSDIEPTECPNNANHIVRANSITNMYELNPYVRTGSISRQIKNSEYTSLTRILYPGQAKVGEIQLIKAVSYMEEGATNYSIRIYDYTNGNIIAEKTCTNTDIEIINLGEISNIPTLEAIIDIQCKIISSNNKLNVIVDDIIIYTDLV